MLRAAVFYAKKMNGDLHMCAFRHDTSRHIKHHWFLRGDLNVLNYMQVRFESIQVQGFIL